MAASTESAHATNGSVVAERATGPADATAYGFVSAVCRLIDAAKEETRDLWKMGSPTRAVRDERAAAERAVYAAFDAVVARSISPSVAAATPSCREELLKDVGALDEFAATHCPGNATDCHVPHDAIRRIVAALRIPATPESKDTQRLDVLEWLLHRQGEDISLLATSRGFGVISSETYTQVVGEKRGLRSALDKLAAESAAARLGARASATEKVV